MSVKEIQNMEKILESNINFTVLKSVKQTQYMYFFLFPYLSNSIKEYDI